MQLGLPMCIVEQQSMNASVERFTASQTWTRIRPSQIPDSLIPDNRSLEFVAASALTGKNTRSRHIRQNR